MNNKSDSDFVTDAFAKLSPIEPSASLSRQVASIPLHHPKRSSEAWWPFAGFFKPAFGLIAAGLLGFFSGGWMPDGAPADSAEVSESSNVAPVDEQNQEASQEKDEVLEGLFALAVDDSVMADDWDFDLVEASPQEKEVLQ